MKDIKSNPEKQQVQVNELSNQTSKEGHGKFLRTLLLILFLQTPQVISAWLTIAEKIPLLYRQNLPSIEVIKN